MDTGGGEMSAIHVVAGIMILVVGMSAFCSGDFRFGLICVALSNIMLRIPEIEKEKRHG